MSPVSSLVESTQVARDRREREIRAAQTRLLCANTNVGVSVTVLAASALSYLQWEVIPHPLVLGWLAYMLLVTFARFVLGRVYSRLSPVATRTRWWGPAFAVGAGLSGAGWGAAGILLYPETHPANQVFLAFVLGGVMLGGASTFAARSEAFLAFLIPIGFPAAVRLLLQGDHPHVAMGLLAALFTVAILIIAWRLHRTVARSLSLRFENDDLVTDLQAAKEGLEALNQDLELRVENRTAELDRAVFRLQQEIAERKRLEDERDEAEARLRHAQKLEAIGSLAGGLAHEFNNLLTAIAGYTTLVQDQLPKDMESWGYLEQVLKASARAADLVRRLLVFSRKGDHKPALVPVAEVVTEALALFRASLPSSIGFRQRIEPDCGYIFADPSLIQQVVVNLCTNSYQAMDGTPGQLEVDLEALAPTPSSRAPAGLPDGPCVKLTVRDTGHGIPPEIAERIFDPFFTTRSRDKATGLGLSVVHGIVSRYGGVVTFESKPSQGTAFFVYLPQQPADRQLAAEVSRSVPDGKERILFVDDEVAIARLGELMLQGLGYVVTSKTSSEEALRLFAEDPLRFDLVITDLTMPRMTGKELIVMLKQIRADTPVILASGFNDAGMSSQEMNALGIGEFVKKPFSRSVLAEAVDRVLGRRPNPRGELTGL
jgi:signal transduction histidine kinase/ActR/RegA family two-component response regulator